MFKRSIRGDAKKFYSSQYEVAIRIAGLFMVMSLDKELEKPKYAAYKSWDNASKLIAGAVIEELIGIEPDISDAHYEKARNIAPVWADYFMNDAELAELIVQTVRMHFIFQSFLAGENWLEVNEQGKIISRTLETYGARAESSPTPKSFTLLLEKWTKWAEAALGS